MKNVISMMFSKFVMVVVYMLVGYATFNLYLVLRDMVKAIYHTCFGG